LLTVVGAHPPYRLRSAYTAGREGVRKRHSLGKKGDENQKEEVAIVNLKHQH